MTIRELRGRTPEKVRARQLLRAELDALALQPADAPLTHEQAYDLGVVGAHAEQVA